MNTLFALAFATALLGLSPGPAVFATIGRALSLGLGSTYLFVIGIVAGDLVFALLAMFGLAVIASHYTIIFLILKIAGGSYLLYLGLKSWKSAKAKAFEKDFNEAGWKLVSSGFLLTASNPKDLLFFIGFLPAFMDLERSTITDFLTASIVIAVTFFATLSFYAISANRMRKLFKNPKAIMYLNRIAGVMLIAVGILVMVT